MSSITEARAEAERALVEGDLAAERGTPVTWKEVRALHSVIRTLLAALPETPRPQDISTDDREALAGILRDRRIWNGGATYLEDADVILAWMSARRPSPPTEEQIEAAKRAVWNSGAQYHSNMAMCEKYARAALEAAARVGGEA